MLHFDISTGGSWRSWPVRVLWRLRTRFKHPTASDSRRHRASTAVGISLGESRAPLDPLGAGGEAADQVAKRVFFGTFLFDD